MTLYSFKNKKEKKEKDHGLPFPYLLGKMFNENEHN